MRKKIVAGNWKLNTNVQEGVALATEISKLVAANSKVDCKSVCVIIAPPFTHLTEIGKVVKDVNICLSAQNCASETSGAFTGEVAVDMLKSAGCEAVIIGHSERRSYYLEDDVVLSKKVKLAIEAGIRPIFCCGEILDQREAEKHFDVVKSQIENALFDLSEADFSKIIIAYEPIWAIGTGKVATPEQAQEMHKYIRDLVKEKYGEQVADNTTILYGGSCKPANAAELFSNPDVDGGLIGGASLEADSFLGIVDAI